MPSTDPRERHLVAEIAANSCRWDSDNEAEQARRREKVRVARLNLRSARARRKASEWLQLAADAEAELASGGADVTS